MKTTSRLLCAGVCLLGVASLGLWLAHREESQPVHASPVAAGKSSDSPAPTVPATVPAAAPRTDARALTAEQSISRSAAFKLWAEKFAAGSPQDRAGLLAEGDKLAADRRAEMARLIKSDPAEALAEAIPYRLRKQLPESILAQIEKPISGRGDFKPVHGATADEAGQLPGTGYQVVLNGIPYQAYTYGQRLTQPGRSGIYLHGIAVTETLQNGEAKRIVALSPEAGRILEPEEAQDDVAAGKAPKNAVCGVAGGSAQAQGTPVLLEFGERLYPFCRASHALQFNQQLTEIFNRPHDWNAAAGFSPAGFRPAASTDTLPPPPRGFTQGIRKLLYMRVLFADDPVPPQSEDIAQRLAQVNNQYFTENSYGTLNIQTTVTPLLRLPQKRNYYGESFVPPPAQQARIAPDAATEAANLGYFTADYDYAYVLFNPLPEAGYFVRDSDMLLNGQADAITHGIAHNLGLGDAYSWDPSGRIPSWPVPPLWPVLLPADPDSAIGHGDINAANNGLVAPAPFQPYGDTYDLMGGGVGHIGAYTKWVLNWLPDPFVQLAKTSTTNRIYAFDTPRITDGRTYAVRVHKDFQQSGGSVFEREYWASYRQGFEDNPWESSGIELHWNFGGINVLLDTTPETSYAKQDAAIVVGRTFSDPAADVFFTPIAKGGGPDPSDKWIDLVTQIGPFPFNLPPVMTLQADNLNVTNGATVTFNVTAQDPDGDALAYNWDFGDQGFGLNTNRISRTFTTNGQYVVRCEVSDMKGGLMSAFVVVTVGTPGTFMVSGRILDINGAPVANARVHNSGTFQSPDTPGLADGQFFDPTVTTLGSYRYSYTDSQGYYTIGNINPGIYTNRAFRFGYRTDPFNFTDPVSLTNGNANNIDFVATPLPVVRVQKSADTGEGSPDPGIFTLIRDGDLSTELKVRYMLSGSAVIGGNYVPPPGNLFTNPVSGVRTTNIVGFVTIPAGFNSTDVEINPIDDNVGFGDFDVRMTLLLQTGGVRIASVATNILTTNGSVITTNTIFVSRTNAYAIPGWEIRQVGVNNAQTWFQTDPTYVLGHAETTLKIQDAVAEDDRDNPLVAVLSVMNGLTINQMTGETVFFPGDPDALETRGDLGMIAILLVGLPRERDLTVNYTVTGDASNGVDFAQLSGSAVIPAGEFFVLVPIHSVNDLFVEGNETLNVALAPGGYDTLTGFDSADLVLVEDDLPFVSIYSRLSVIGNTTNTAVVTVSRTGTLDKDLLVNYLVTGTATSGQDYLGLPGSVIIPAGQLTADIFITSLNNSTSALPKTVTLLLSDSPAYNIYNNNSATVTIVDRFRLPVVSLQTVNGTLAEGNGVGAFRVQRTGPTTNSLLVYFEMGGSAWEGADYAPVGTNVLIPAGSATANINITALPDPFRELGDVSGQDDVIIQLRPGTNYLLGDIFGLATSGAMQITDDDGTDLPAVGFMLRSSSEREDAGPPSRAIMWVKCSANPATNLPITVEYRITGGSGVPNINYIPIAGVTGFLRFSHYFAPPNPPNVEDHLLPIVVTNLNDGLASGNKTFVVTLSNPARYVTNMSLATNMGQILTNVLITPIPTNAYLGDSRTHTFTIVDVGVNQVTIAAATPLAYESGPPGQFIITRTGPTNLPLTVSFAVTGTAASGNDFSALGVNGTITIPAGTNTAVLNLLPLDDPTEEVAESVVVTLLNRPGYSVGSPSTATILLVSDDGTLQFTSESYHFFENAGPAVVSVLRTGATNLAVSVDYQILNGTATNQLDFLGTNGTIFFAPGQTIQNIVVPLIDDLLVEDAETFTVVLANPSGGVPLGGQNSTTVFIDNDDAAYVFSTNSFYANENAVTALITVNRLGFTNAAASVRFSTTDNTARSSNDYVGTNIVLNFAVGATSVVAQVRLLNDTNIEGDEFVNLFLSNPSTNTTVGVLSNSTLVIVDDECSVEFAAANFDVPEYAGFAQVVVHRNGGTVHPLSVTFSTRNNTASNGVDYTAVTQVINMRGDAFVLDTNGTGALMFQKGDQDITVLVPILDDTIGEGNETFFVRLSGLSGPGGLPARTFFLTANTNSTVTILDNELPGNLDYEYNAAIGANSRVRSMAFQSDQKVVFGGEFTTFNNIGFNRVARLQTSGLLDPSFNPGAGANDAIFAVAAQPDNRILIGGLFTTIDGVNRTRVARLSSDGNIDLSFNGGLGPNNTVRAIAVQPDGKILIAGEFGTVDGTNRAYLARLESNGRLDLSFNANLNNQVLTVVAQADGKILAGGAFTTAGGTNRNRIVRLNSNGTADVTFDPGTGFNGSVNSIAVQADGRVLVGGLFTTFGPTNRNYLARLNSDGSLDSSFNATGGPNSSVQTVSVQPNGKIFIGGNFTSFNGALRPFFTRLRADGAPDSTFNVGTGADAPVLTSLIQNNSAIVIGGDFTVVQGIPRGHIARVHGDEKSNVTGVEFASATYQVVENQGPAIINVVRTGNTNTAFSVQFFTQAGTAASNLDYTNRNGTIAFAPGQASASFSIPIVNDLLFELDETVFLRLTNASSPTIDMSGQTNATLFIVDDEKGVQFATNNFAVFEESTNAVITVVRSGTLNGTVTVEFRATSGTAISGVDFIGVTNSLTFANGESAKTILVPLLDDNAAEADETVVLSLLNPTGAVTNTPFISTLTILNTDSLFGTFVYNATNRIAIVDGQPAIPYPSSVLVAGLTGLVSRVAVTLVGLTHTFPGDIDMLLVGPGGQSVVVMSDAGNTFDVVGATLRFEDGAFSYLPDNGQIVSGTYKPTDYGTPETFFAPAPGGPYGSTFAGFSGTQPNGTWSLYVMDDRGTDVGEILNGWRLEITTVNPTNVVDLGITMTDSPDPVMAGNTLTYSITVNNAGTNGATAVTVTNVLPVNVNFISAVASQGACTNRSGVVSCALGNLSVGGSVLLTMTVTPLQAGLLTNVMVVSAAQPDVTPLNSSATAVTTVTPAPVADLNVGISDLPDPLFAGNNIIYSINLTNNGPLVANSVVFTDNLPPVLGLISASTTLGSCTVTSNSVSCNLGDMTSGSRAFISVVARSLASGLLTNTVSATSSSPDLTPAVASAVTTAFSAADLLVYQIESADPAPIGNPLTYTIVVTNLGVSTAHAVNLVDTLPQTAAFGSVFPSQGSCANIGGVLICDLGTISNGAAVTISVDVQPLSLQPLINAATVNAIEFDPNPTNNTSTEITATTSLGNGIIITPTTNAQALATAVTASGATGIRVTGVELEAHQTDTATSSGLFSIGNPPFTYGLTRPGIVLSTGNVKDYETGPNTQSGFTTAYNVQAIASQEALLDPITSSGGVDFDHYDVTRLNLHFDMLAGFDRIEFKVVFGSEEWAEFVGSSFIDGFGIYLNGSNIAFSAGQPINIDHPNMLGLQGTELDGILAPGGNPILTFSASVPPNSTDNLLTFIIADTSDPVLDTTVFVSSLQGGVGPNADMAIQASATPEPVIIGSNLTYNITVQNRGPNAAPNVIVTDVLPAGMAYIGSTATQGGCTLSNATVLCALGTVNNSLTANITLTVQPLSSGRFTNVVTVRSDLADFRFTNDLAAVASTVVDPGEFLNPGFILLADAAPSLPNPSVINVSGVAGVISKVTVSLVELSHTYPADLDVLLVGPFGQKVMLMSDAGAGNAVNGITLRFDDDAATTLSQIGQLVNGTFRPTDYEPGDVLFTPAPAGPYGTSLAVFQSTNPNGNWSLFVNDDHGVDSGVINGGWRLNIQTMPGVPTPTLAISRVGVNLIVSWPDTFSGYTLESSPILGTGAIWSPAGGTVVQGGGLYSVTLALPGAGNGFYRLRGP